MRKKYGIPVVCLFLVLSMLLCACGNSQQEQYDAARNLFFYGQYSEARKAFRALEDYSDSKAMVTACDYQLAMIQLSNEEYLAAAAAFAALGDYGNAKGLSRAAETLAALQQYEGGDREGAISALAGTRLAQDLEASLFGGQDLAGLVGTWTVSLDILPEVKAALEELALNQDKMDKAFVDSVELKQMLVKISLEVSKDGLAVLSLSQEELDRVAKTFGTQLHQGVTAYYDTVIDQMAKDEGYSREEIMEHRDASDAEGVFVAEKGIDFAEFERRMTPSKQFSSIHDIYNGSGVASTDGDTIQLAFPDNTWTVDDSKDGKLTITDGVRSLTLTRIS